MSFICWWPSDIFVALASIFYPICLIPVIPIIIGMVVMVIFISMISMFGLWVKICLYFHFGLLWLLAFVIWCGLCDLNSNSLNMVNISVLCLGYWQVSLVSSYSYYLMMIMIIIFFPSATSVVTSLILMPTSTSQ